MHKNTKIVCTLGPASDSVTEITKLAQAGMDMARLNFSHGNYKHHKQLIDNIRKVKKITGKNLQILQDLQGPKIRIGQMPEEGIRVKKGEKLTLTIKAVTGERISKNHTLLPINYRGITKDLRKNDLVLIDDGLIEAKVTGKAPQEIHCKVKIGGLITSRRGVNFPTASISQTTITAKDREDLKFGLKYKVDLIALSFVKSPQDIRDLRKLMPAKKPIPIIAKIERHEAIKNLEAIIKEADGVMVARGDLGVNIPPEQVPIIQKLIIHLANKHEKPVITATQVLQSMITSPIPTRAEVSDAANAVYDHSDAVMLSNETSVGKYPFRATRMLTKIARAVENEMKKHHNNFS